MKLVDGFLAYYSGRDSRWYPESREYLKGNPRCVACGQKSKTVHHVIPVHVAKHLEMVKTNWASMCKRCHFVIGHACNWHLWTANFREVVEAINRGIQGRVSVSTNKFTRDKLTVRGDDDGQPTPGTWDIGPNLTKVLVAFVAAITLFVQGYVIYLTREVKSEIKDVKAEAESAKIQSEKNGKKLKKVEDEKREAENKHRAMQGKPPLPPIVEDDQ